MANEIHFGAIPIEDIQIGMKVSYSQTITDSDIKTFAGLSGDHNPVHVDEKYAENSRFKRRIAHGLMSAGFFSQLFGTKLPGPGCVYTAQSLKFLRPVYINDTVVATVEVIAIDLLRKRVWFKTYCTVNNKIVIDGQAEIYIP
ncbi:MaoC family dehydratase [Acinetobacter indicus]|uniref:MaoC family dehydratase n=1 Tax=Acinetobacter indicus TaxID=756892 RepID=UPI001443ED3A|nr:MaoC family dehydratase [Acinetobacter indicus]